MRGADLGFDRLRLDGRFQRRFQRAQGFGDHGIGLRFRHIHAGGQAVALRRGLDEDAGDVVAQRVRGRREMHAQGEQQPLQPPAQHGARKIGEHPVEGGLHPGQGILQRPVHEGQVFLDLAREWDIPFLIHSSVAESDLWAQAHDILDIAAANLDIRFCAAHSCRYDKQCLDRVNDLPNTWFDCSAHCIHCECAVDDLPNIAPRQNRFETDYSDPGRVIADLAAAYPNKFLWGSDSPFYSYAARIDDKVLRLISTYQREVEALKQSPPEVVHRIANVNTRNFLKLQDESILTD